MKIVASSDWHADHLTMGVSRGEEVERAVWQSVKAAVESCADAYFFLGDLCDPDSGPVVFEAVRLALNVAMVLKQHDIASFWLCGNHDHIELGRGTTTLTPMRALVCEQVRLFEQPGKTKLEGQAFVVALPFTSTSHAYDPEKVAKDLWGGHPGAVVIGHLSVPGVIPGEETTEMPRGRDVRFPLELFKDRDDVLLMNGHYHRQQAHKHMGCTVHIPGSPARFTHGEEDHVPGFLMIEGV